MKSRISFLLMMLQASVIFAKVKLPALVSDGMVLQRDKILKMWGWADNPVGANLYNKEGLPASSFRTDSWGGKTFTK